MKKSNCPRKSICAGPSEGQGGALAVVKRPVVAVALLQLAHVFTRYLIQMAQFEEKYHVFCVICTIFLVKERK